MCTPSALCVNLKFSLHCILMGWVLKCRAAQPYQNNPLSLVRVDKDFFFPLLAISLEVPTGAVSTGIPCLEGVDLDGRSHCAAFPTCHSNVWHELGLRRECCTFTYQLAGRYRLRSLSPNIVLTNPGVEKKWAPRIVSNAAHQFAWWCLTSQGLL